MVDGRNPKQPVDTVIIPLFAGFYTSQVVVWDFFHQQYASTASWILVFFWSIFGPWTLFVPTSSHLSPTNVTFWSRCEVLNLLNMGYHWIWSLGKSRIPQSLTPSWNPTLPGLTRMYQVAKFTAKALLANVAKPRHRRSDMPSERSRQIHKMEGCEAYVSFIFL